MIYTKSTDSKGAVNGNSVHNTFAVFFVSAKAPQVQKMTFITKHFN